MALVERKIDLSVKMASNPGTNQPNQFSESGTDTLQVSGLRTSVRIQNAGTPVGCKAQVAVYGLTQSIMNQLSALGMTFNIVPKNVMTISAGDDESGMSVVFSGTVQQAYADFSSQPDVPMRFECLLGLAEAAAPAQVSSFTGATSVESVMSSLAGKMGFGFENNGVKAQLASPYFRGSLWNQAQQCADHANIEWGVVNGNKLVIWPKGGNRTGGNVPVIGPPPNGEEISYPAFTPQGIIVSTVFNKDISFGSLVKVDSSLLSGIKGAQPQSNFPTQWAVYKLDLALDAQVPDGEWRSTVYAYNPNSGKTILPPAK